MDTKAALMGYIKQELARGRAPDLREDDDLLSTGIIDSLGILQLVGFIEERFGVQVPDEEVVLENFQTVNAIMAYLAEN